VAGGVQNTNNGNYGTLSGGGLNKVSGNYATVPGGFANTASGAYSVAAGQSAVASQAGAFVWADSANYPFDPYAQVGPQGVANSFNVRSTGGFYIVTGVNSSGTITSGAYIAGGATSWSTLSDRNAKKNFAAVDCEAVLEKLAKVSVEQWNYKWEKDSDTPNLGPMAQDFKHAFYPGRDDKSITTLEFDGVELAAIKGLSQKLDEKDAEIQQLKQSVAQLQALVSKLAKDQSE
jgi:trimeric autotransporter adhesin